MNPEKAGSKQARWASVRGLYAIADADAARGRGLDWLRCAKAMLAAEVPVLQLRAKDLGAAEAAAALRSAKEHLGRGKTILIQNDRADIAALVGAHGVHVGQADFSMIDLARVYPDLCSGLSTHSIKQLITALDQRRAGQTQPSYLAFGPVFQTGSKKNAEPEVGIAALTQAFELCSKAGVPLVAIGGIGLAELEAVARHAHLIAAIGLLLPPAGTEEPYKWIEQRCREMNRRILSLQPHPLFPAVITRGAAD